MKDDLRIDEKLSVEAVKLVSSHLGYEVRLRAHDERGSMLIITLSRDAIAALARSIL